MIPLTQDPTLIALVNDNEGLKIATNIAPQIMVIITDNIEAFAKLSAGMPFQIDEA